LLPAGAGAAIGPEASIAMLVLHVIYGLVLRATYAALRRREAREAPPARSAQEFDETPMYTSRLRSR
jgi:hypothetical protein